MKLLELGFSELHRRKIRFLELGFLELHGRKIDSSFTLFSAIFLSSLQFSFNFLRICSIPTNFLRLCINLNCLMVGSVLKSSNTALSDLCSRTVGLCWRRWFFLHCIVKRSEISQRSDRFLRSSIRPLHWNASVNFSKVWSVLDRNLAI